ncbi:response regulator [Salipaludibacillus sp. CUR1]|uniref:response regulator n=1 Tax=Salipaludibacillus sp. CUR1 TaxID=2820003 RepID=UPI001E5A435B|nr:response regulator [Salipaludibacillus sp. CUR1]MCE7791740.1 response regulator [Salipaludibacillus sp. CUR1]
MNVLIVDDEILALDYLENLLVRTGKMTNIYRFSDSEQALKAIELHLVDVLFLDIEMPGLNGFELAEHFLEANRNIDVVFVTAHRDFAVKAFEIDAVDYLVKPIRYERLCHTIERLNKRKNTTETPASLSELCLSIKNGITLGESVNEGKELTWRTAKARELFLYLLHHHNKNVQKSEIVEVIWSTQNIEKSFSQLYTTVYHIRKEIKPYAPYIQLISKDDGYRLDVSNLRIDVFDWKKTLKVIDDLDDFENRKTVERLLEEYSGNYLQHSVYLWPGDERLNQKTLWREKALALAVYYENLKTYTKALYWCQKILQEDETDEEIHFRIMKINALQNRAELVKQQYRTLVNILQKELDVRPDRSIEEWYIQWLASKKK